MSLLLLRLSGPMQSWGSRSRFSDRDTEREPTKSGVVGMLCAALGKPREESPNDGFPTLHALSSLRMGVRIDSEGWMCRDFQTAGGGKWRGGKYGVAKASGGTKGTEISCRAYLADAAFLVGLEGDLGLLGRLDAALAAPVWALSLGRKSYPPAEPARLPDGFKENETLDAGLRSYPMLSCSTRSSDDGRVRLMLECLPGEPGEIRQDVPLCFISDRRSFGSRLVRQAFAELPKAG